MSELASTVASFQSALVSVASLIEPLKDAIKSLASSAAGMHLASQSMVDHMRLSTAAQDTMQILLAEACALQHAVASNTAWSVPEIKGKGKGWRLFAKDAKPKAQIYLQEAQKSAANTRFNTESNSIF